MPCPCLLALCVVLAGLQAGSRAAAADHGAFLPPNGEAPGTSGCDLSGLRVSHPQALTTAEVLDSIQSGSLGKIAECKTSGGISSCAADPRGNGIASPPEVIEVPVSRLPDDAASPFLSQTDRSWVASEESDLIDAISRRNPARSRQAAQAAGILKHAPATGSLPPIAATSAGAGGMADPPFLSLVAGSNPPVAFGCLFGISALLVRRRERRIPHPRF